MDDDLLHLRSITCQENKKWNDKPRIELTPVLEAVADRTRVGAEAHLRNGVPFHIDEDAEPLPSSVPAGLQSIDWPALELQSQQPADRETLDLPAPAARS